MEQPLVQWTPSIAACGLACYTGDKFPNWKYDFFAGGLRGELHRIRIQNEKAIADEVILSGLGRVRDVRSAPDGFIYIVLNQPDRIVRLVPAGDGQSMIRDKSRGGFTLVELLVVIGVIALLASLSLTALSQIGAASDRSKAISNMRQIGAGVALFAADNDGKLPGPLWPGQLAQLDPTRSGRLVRELAPYLGIPTPIAPKVEPLFVPPAYRKVVSSSFLDSARTYVVNMSVREGDKTIIPWGNLASPPFTQPLKLAAIPHRLGDFPMPIDSTRELRAPHGPRTLHQNQSTRPSGWLGF